MSPTTAAPSSTTPRATPTARLRREEPLSRAGYSSRCPRRALGLRGGAPHAAGSPRRGLRRGRAPQAPRPECRGVHGPSDLLGDRTRLRIVELLSDGERSVGELARLLGEPQPKVSNHLACLRWCGFVTTHRERHDRGRAMFPVMRFPPSAHAAGIAWSFAAGDDRKDAQPVAGRLDRGRAMFPVMRFPPSRSCRRDRSHQDLPRLRG